MATPLETKLASLSRAAILGALATGGAFTLSLAAVTARSPSPAWERSIAVLLADPAVCALAGSCAALVCVSTSSLLFTALLDDDRDGIDVCIVVLLASTGFGLGISAISALQPCLH